LGILFFRYDEHAYVLYQISSGSQSDYEKVFGAASTILMKLDATRSRAEEEGERRDPEEAASVGVLHIPTFTTKLQRHKVTISSYARKGCLENEL
jgi:hypothetical protein